MTLCAYLAAVRLARRFDGSPLLNPTLVAILIVAAAIKVSGLDYASYAQSAAFITFLLPPAVVLLAVPLFRQRQLLRESGLVIAAALAVGLPVGILSTVGFARLLGADMQTLLSLAPRTTTSGIAMGISEKIGGLPALTSVMAITTGIVGAVCGPPIARLLRVDDPRSVGLGMGIASHAIATGRALQLGEVMGAFAGLGMGLNGIGLAIVLPMVVRWF